MLRSAIVGAIFLASGLAVTVLLTGCSNNNNNPGKPATTPPTRGTANTSPPAQSTASADEEHGHKAGAHGGIIVSLGQDSYHVEAIVEKSGTLRIYTLGKEETRIQEVPAQPLTAYVNQEGEADSVSLELKPLPQPGDTAGKTSLFVAELPAELRGQPLNVTIPNIAIAGERFRLGFSTKQEQHQETTMPEKVANDEEKALYLTPGGIYTQADIQANGNVVASQKFKGQMASHDLKPKTGDKICPITLTKANPKFTWVVAGEKYEFCCPPCVDEFVKQAKTTPTEIKAPVEYVQK
ncbi:MAG: hypothetical protein SFX18_02610 [Pirellulales bacterium]|nr:hypothetical protein [Pirellulales bacterium]